MPTLGPISHVLPANSLPDTMLYWMAPSFYVKILGVNLWHQQHQNQVPYFSWKNGAEPPIHPSMRAPIMVLKAPFLSPIAKRAGDYAFEGKLPFISLRRTPFLKGAATRFAC